MFSPPELWIYIAEGESTAVIGRRSGSKSLWEAEFGEPL
jgi:hypothetical protein